MVKKQFTVYVENKPGALATLTGKLAKAEVNIEGISACSSTDVGLIQLVVSNAAKTRAVLKEVGVAFTSQDVVVLPISNELGSLAEVVTKLAKSGININYLYATACDCKKGCRCYAVIGAQNMSAVNKLWSDG